VVVAIGGLALLPVLERSLFAAVRSRFPGQESFLVDLFAGMRLVWKPLVVARFLLLSAAAWGIDAFGITVVAGACGAPMDFGVGVLFVTILAFASAIPATGAVGVIPLAAAFVLPSFGFGKGTALAIGVVLQSLNLLLTAFTGGFGLWLLRYRTASLAPATGGDEFRRAEVL
jgi:uncharacterized membrane protein YbhN (UPF0104 family)